MHLRNHLLPKINASSPLENLTHSMVNTSQAHDLDGLHHEMYDIAEQIKIINKNNAHLIQHLATNNSLPPIVAFVLEAEQSCHSH